MEMNKISDETRRRKGEFFTPTIWVDEAHKMISEVFGENWKEEYVVWDPCSAKMNCTRDYRFKELYCSTIEESDLKTAEQMKYNPEAIKFQYDFLNDGIVDGRIDIEGDEKLPQGLKDALLEGKKMIVLMNPPYGAATEIGFDSKKDISNTKISEVMKSSKWGAPSQQLYAQFLFRLYLLKNQFDLTELNICIYSPPLYLSGPSYKKFRENFFLHFGYENGMIFNSGNFDGVSDWGLTFGIFSNNKSDISNFKFRVKELNSQFEISYLYDKEIYNLDTDSEASIWVRRKTKGLRTNKLIPQFKNSIQIYEGNKSRGSILPNHLGYFFNSNNNISSNPINVAFYTNAYYGGNGLSVIKDNFLDCTSLFSARKLFIGKHCTPFNMKDEYKSPDVESPVYKQWEMDSIVHSLFHIHSYQTSLRDIKYKDKLWDIKNEFFWMSKDDMMSLAESKYFDDVYRDAKSSDERYVYKLLYKEGIYEKLSPDAKEVLDMASELVRKTFDMRKVLNEEKPEYHLNTWDAGWYQIKLILKQFYQDDLREFTKKYKEFEDRMRPLVYELGFLRK